MTPRFLVLFDIDGTLLHSRGAGRAAMKRALTEVYGTAGAIGTHNFANGATDRDTVFRLLGEEGFEHHQIEAGFHQLGSRMASHIRYFSKNGSFSLTPCDGVVTLIDQLHLRADVLLGLITANFRESGIAKLEAAGFDPGIFAVGAFGENSPHREELPLIAVNLAHKHTGVKFTDTWIVIVGDTPRDVICGRSVGARVIAVETGFHSYDQLVVEKPFAILKNLTDTQRVINLITQPEGHTYDSRNQSPI